MSEKACCSLAGKLTPERLTALDDELARPDHRGFKKLALELGSNHMAVKRHKQRCLGFGATEDGTEGGTAGTPEGTRGTSGERADGGVPDVPGEQEHLGSPDGDDGSPRARPRESGNPPGSREDRVRVIEAKIVEGTLVPSDVPLWVDQWGLHESTVRRMVREAYTAVAARRGDVEERRVLAMGKWEFQIRLCDNALANKRLKPMDRALLLKERASAITGWCKAAGVFDDSTKVNINLAGNPVFVSCTEALFAALATFPEAHAAARAALSGRLQALRQAPLGLPSPVSIEVESHSGSAGG